MADAVQAVVDGRAPLPVGPRSATYSPPPPTWAIRTMPEGVVFAATAETLNALVAAGLLRRDHVAVQRVEALTAHASGNAARGVDWRRCQNLLHFERMIERRRNVYDVRGGFEDPLRRAQPTASSLAGHRVEIKSSTRLQCARIRMF